MPEYVFNVSVAVMVRVHLGLGKPLTEGAATLGNAYRRDFVDDGFESDLIGAAKTLLEFIRKAKPRFTGDTPDFHLRHMQFFFSNYHLDGSKKRRKFLDIRLFGGVREPITDRQSKFVTSYLTFIFLTTAGRVPLPPPGWRL
jgi:hypothetical protein